MDGIYRGVEALLLAASFALGAFALLLSPAAPLGGQASVSLPMLTVVGDGPGGATR